MRYLLALTIALAPLAAHASYGPEVTQPQTQGMHLTELAWVSTSGSAEKPGCTDPTPQQIVYACAVMAPAGN